MGPLNQIYKKLDAGGSIYYAWATAMHTRIDVVLCHRPQDECRTAAGALIAELERLETRLNRFDPESDLARINASAAKQYVDLDPEMWGILTSALGYGAKTDWFFDVTVQSSGRLAPPAGRVVMDAKKQAATFSGKGVVIDLGGFAKGYGLEKVQRQLLEAGWQDFLINFGNSSVCARGNQPGGPGGWKVGVENIRQAGTNALELTLHNQSLNTSGNTPKHTRHIFSKAEGGLVDRLESVSVVTASPLDGEALSTALFAAGKETAGFLKNFETGGVYAVKYAPAHHTVEVLF